MRNRFLLIFAGVILLTLPLAHAQTTATAPTPAPSSLAPGSRVLRNFDFEEASQGNYEAIPMYWSKVVGRGFPAYATGRFDHEVFRPSDSNAKTHSSFRMDIDAGSAAYRFVAPAGERIEISPSADYFILAFVKTKNLKYARAQITAWYADEDGKLLSATETHSDAYADESDADSAPIDNTTWHVLHIYMPGPPVGGGKGNDAKSLVLQLGLLQPQQLSSHPLGRFELYHQDIKGTAWFDDLVVFQLPRVSVSVPATVSGSIFGTNDNIALDLAVADLSQLPTATAAQPNTALNIHLNITDPDGLIFATQKWSITSLPNQLWTQSYSHPPLPPGLYTATLDVADGSTIIARRRTSFLSMPSAPPKSMTSGELPADEFGVVATALPVESWNELPPILRHLGAGLIEIPAWRKDMSEESLLRQDKQLDALFASLQRLDVHSIGAFSELPNVLATKLSTSESSSVDSLLALLDADPAVWKPYISFLLARYSNRVDLWELGSEKSPFSGVISAVPQAVPISPDKYPKLYNTTYTELASLLNRPQLVIPWNALFDFDASQYPHAILDLRLPSSIKASQIPNYINSFKQAGDASPNSARNILAHIDPLEDQVYSRADRLADFAQRVIYARTANPRATLIDLPIARRTTLGTFAAHTQPEELLLIYRTLIHELGNHAYKRELPLASGLKAFLFQRDSAGVIALWNDSAATASIPLDLPLGPNPRLVDLSGNISPLTPDPATGLTHIEITAAPFLLDNIDAELVSLRASFALSSSTFPAGAGLVQTDVLLTNPYTYAIAGSLRLNPPKGWTAEPSSLTVNAGPGATFRQRITLRYPFAESVGPKQMNAVLKLEASALSSDSHPLQLSFPFALASDIVEIECYSQLLPNGDLSVHQMITNISTAPINAQAYVLVPGYARQQRFVVDLQPNQTVIKRFVFPLSTFVSATPSTTPADISAALAGKSATLGLRQTDGRTLISKTLPLN